MNKFMNAPENFVAEMLEGIALANPGKLKYQPKFNCIYRADRPNDNFVSVIQGSGSGHEPAHVMAVGPGMLDAACPGNVFAAPPMEYVLECTRLMNSKKGVLHLINNYTGDRAAWEMAREMAEAEDLQIGVVLINDDVAVMDSAYTVGRRGVAGNFFVIKACGAAAAKGADLATLVKLGEKAWSAQWVSPSPVVLRRAKINRSSSWQMVRWKWALAFMVKKAAAEPLYPTRTRSSTSFSMRFLRIFLTIGEMKLL